MSACIYCGGMAPISVASADRTARVSICSDCGPRHAVECKAWEREWRAAHPVTKVRSGGGFTDLQLVGIAMGHGRRARA